MRDFDLVMPRTLSEALAAMSASDISVQPIAGGTDMVVDVRSRRAKPDVLVALQHIPELQGVVRENGMIRLGARTTVTELLQNPLIADHADIARQAAQVFANPMVRNLATVGGNVGSASPAGDIITPLLALDAEVELLSENGGRKLSLENFLVGPRKTVRRLDEIIVALRFVRPAPHSGHAFYKLGLRQADAISIINVAVLLERDGPLVGDVRIALGAVSPTPIRAHQAESILRGKTFTDSEAREAARIASDEAAPIDDLRAGAEYRRRMVRVYAERMLQQAWSRAR